MATKDWKDELSPLIAVGGLQFVVLRLVDWAKHPETTQPMAETLKANHFFYLPQIVAVAAVIVTARFLRRNVDFRDMELRDILRGSGLLFILGFLVIGFAHADQLCALGASAFPGSPFDDASKGFDSAELFQVLRAHATLRFGIDLIGLVIWFVGIRATRHVSPDERIARDALRSGDYGRAGDAYLKVGDLEKAKKAFRKGKLPVRLAALELRDGNAKEAGRLYDEAGPAFAWEAAKAWEAAGDLARAGAARQAALAEAKALGRWDRLAEVAEVVGDAQGLADATRKIAEQGVGVARQALWKRAAEAARAAGRGLEAAEAYRQCGEFLTAASLFEAAGKLQEAAQDFERGGELQKAAAMLHKAGNEPGAYELLARDAEARGDFRTAGENAFRSGNVQRAAGLFERASAFSSAAYCWRESKRPDKAAPLYQKAGDLQSAAVCWEEAGHAEKAALLWRELKVHDRAAVLFQKAGRYPESAASFEALGQFAEAIPLYKRAGKSLDAARCALAMGQREQAWEFATGATRSDPATRAFFLELARSHIKAGEARDAVHVLQEALGQSPITPETQPGYELLVGALALSGSRREAKELALTIASVDPSYAQRQQVSLATQETERVTPQPSRAPASPAAVSASGSARAVPPQPPPPQAPPASGLFPRPPMPQGPPASGLFQRPTQPAGAEGPPASGLYRRPAAEQGPPPPSGLYQRPAAAFRPEGPGLGASGAAAPAAVSAARPAAPAYAAPAPPPAAASSPAVPAAGPPSQGPPPSGMFQRPNYAAPAPAAPQPPPVSPAAPSYGPASYPPPPSATPSSVPPYSAASSGQFPASERPEDRYQLVSELGRGGMGVVHKALDRKLDRYVALKILPWQMRGDEMAMRYFAREARAIAALKHPNIVSIYDFGEGFGSVYIAMEFVEGPNLQALLKSDPGQIRRSWRDWFVQAARGVAAAHAKGILHRDIKPANMMLDEHGTLRLLDFGLARGASDSGATSKLIGTPAFFPPELLRGEPPTPAADVYSLGASFYTLATGRWPYVGDDILVARLERDPEDPRKYATHLTQEEAFVLLKSLARYRPERYPDAGELLAALLCIDA